MLKLLSNVFSHLDECTDQENRKRFVSGAPLISEAEITVLGQTSLLAQPELTIDLELAQTGDLDAKLRCDYFIKSKLKEILPEYGLIYDEDSELIFIPEGSEFNKLGHYKNLSVKVIDPESALVSKAVKAPEKNKQLIRAAISSGNFPNLVDRITQSGGYLENFI